MQLNIFIRVTFIILFYFLRSCYSYKGLFVMTFGTKSHMNFFTGVVEALAQNGHEITVISPFKPSTEETIRHIQLTDYSKIGFGQTFNMNSYQLLQSFKKYVPEACLAAANSPEVLKVMEEDYDYIILSLFFADCFLNYVHEKKIPLIYLSPNVLMSPYSERFGAPEFSSVTPLKVFSLTYPLSFFGRVITAFAGEFFSFVMRKVSEESVETLARKQGIWKPETPSLYELQKQASIIFINCVRALEIPIKSTPPTVIYAGGIHIKPRKPLPQDLETWFSGSGESGFILFSLGTAVKPALMKKGHLQIILSVLGSLDQRVIFKWDSTEIENLPPNVKLSPWLPQQDILAHPNIRLFITHGGLFSTQEATFFGVPVVGMPVFGDQIQNVAETVEEGYGLQINWNEITEDKFRAVIMEALTSSSIRETVKHRSKLMKDWPTTPNEDVVFWVEYVLRHNGARHLQSPLVHLPWYKIYNVDVWIFILTLLILLTIISACLSILCFKFITRRYFKRKME